MGKCCICSSRYQRCTRCLCVKEGRPCTNCAKGTDCQNRVPVNNSKEIKDGSKYKRLETIKRAQASSRAKSGTSSEEEEDEEEDRKEEEEEDKQEANDEGIIIISVEDVARDGNCFFRCVSKALYGTEDNHLEIREEVVESMSQNEKVFKGLVDEKNYQQHLQTMKNAKVWATQAELMATSKRYNQDIIVRSLVNGTWQWLNYSFKDCDHKRKYIAIECQNHHFRLLQVNKRPCTCKKTSEKSARNRMEKEIQQNSNISTSSGPLWLGMKLQEAEQLVNDIYEDIVFVRSWNLFEPPRSGAAKRMITIMANLVNEYNGNAPNRTFALTALMILPPLLLQRPHKHPTRKEVSECFQRRLNLWEQGELNELRRDIMNIKRREGERFMRPEDKSDDIQKFAKLMRAGEVNAALRIISEENSKGPLQVTDSIRDILNSKHPAAQNANASTLLKGPCAPKDLHRFDEINNAMIWKKTVRTQGGAGPSGLNARMMKVILSKKRYGDAAIDFQRSLASLARKIATEECNYITPLIARRLIPLDKNPGVRPIGIGEVIMRIIGKCIMEIIREDVKEAAGNLQVCTGQRAGGEAAIHAVKRMYQEEGCDAVLLVDATNAFNSINREAMLHNIEIICPTFHQYLMNTYGVRPSLYINGGEKHKKNVIYSCEGTTQGDPVAMAMYALGMSVLQSNISHDQTNIKSVAYADDLSGAGDLENIRKWWQKLSEIGPKYGYFPNPQKSCLIVKKDKEEQAKRVFKTAGIPITTEGQRHLGAAIGSATFKEEYIKGKVMKWTAEIIRLSQFAETEPHAAYTAFTFGLKHRWTYLSRTLPDIAEAFQPLEDAIANHFIPAITRGHRCSSTERELLALPPRLGGLGIINPTRVAPTEYQNSLTITSALIEHIVKQEDLNYTSKQSLYSLKRNISQNKQKVQTLNLERILPNLLDLTQRKVEMAQETGASNWLSSLPIKAKGFSLTKQEFHDAIALRYGWPIEGLPDLCTCGENFTQQHAMVCRKGGFISMRHDEIRDITTALLSEVCKDVAKEPRLQPLTGEKFALRSANTDNDARVDISARGFWTKGQRAFFDIRIFEPTSPCHQKMTLSSAHEKKNI